MSLIESSLIESPIDAGTDGRTRREFEGHWVEVEPRWDIDAILHAVSMGGAAVALLMVIVAILVG